MANVSATNRQVEQLLDSLMYNLTSQRREALMRELPVAYNAYMGREFVTVIRTSDNLPI